jgi:coenzyme F420-0:L-glutamate ligase/coenzyme F420-1:gamma-L-glutamate ligase
VTLEVHPVRGVPEVEPGADLPGLLLRALRAQGLDLRDGDVVAVTQKAVSKAEGRVVPERPLGKPGWVAREARRVVARRGELVVVETRHGFVCANAGVDASNVAEGFLSLLPEDPDRSAQGIRAALEAATGARVGVVVTDTFGRPWRRGLVNVAVGAAGVPSLVDLRGTKDALGRVLEATVVALADEVAAASGLVMGKADGVPAALVRGLRLHDPPLPASALVRSPKEDLFALSPLEAAVPARAQRFGPGEVDSEALEEAATVALEDREGLVVALRSAAARRRVLASLRAEAEATAPDGAEERVLAGAPVLLLPFTLPARSPQETLLLGGAAVQRLVVALRAHRLASRWVPVPGAGGALREAAAVGGEWVALGLLAVGPEPPGQVRLEPPEPRPPGAPLLWR